MSNSQSTHRHDRSESRLALWISAFAERYPRLYLSIAVIVMSLGYVFLLLFPYLVFEGAGVLVRELPNVKTAEHWIVVEVWFAILLFCLFFSQQIFQLHFPRVQGLKLSKELAPKLYSLIAEVRKQTLQPTIRSGVVLIDHNELRIEETPRFGYPFWMSKTLVIGLPKLQTLTKEQLRGELLYRFSQYASGKFRPSHWIFRTRLLWRKYYDALHHSKRFGEIPLRWFFTIYRPLFESVSVPAVRLDELAADSAVLEWLNDRDYFDVIKSSVIAQVFLDAHYWRKVRLAALKNPQATFAPFEKLEHVSGHLKSTDFRRKCLQRAYDTEQDFSVIEAPLRTRMHNIGQSQLRDVPVVDETAAVSVLGDARKNYVPLIDKLWRSTTLVQWQADYEKRCANVQRVKVLSRKSRQQVMGPKEMLEYARLAKGLRGDPLRVSLRKMVKRAVKNLLPKLLSRNLFHRKTRSHSPANDLFR